ncbi:MAG: hypothetical protein EBY20_02035 [Alphaproteobacteria bacterium]|nr:hypothetical protein [Alphaproteobacteria bacterium]
MNNKDSNQVNIPIFYNQYAKQYYWDKEKAVALSLSLDPTKKIPESFLEEYNNRIQLLKQAMEYGDPVLKLNGTVIKGWGSLEGYIIYPDITPVSLINWCNLQNITFPHELEELVRKSPTSKGKDLVSEIKNLRSTVKNQQTELAKLKQEANLVPNPKKLVSYQKGYIGAMSKIYGHERLLNNFGDKKPIPDTDINSQKKLTLAKIQSDFLLEGISLDDETIKTMTKQSIHHLEEKRKNTSK